MHCKDVQLFRAVSDFYGTSVKRDACLAFVKCCPHCIQARPRKPKAAGHKPIRTKGFASRGQVDLIDFQSFPDRDFKWLLVYVDHGIKFCQLVPLTSKRADGVAVALLKIFSTIGAPAILQSDNGREFSNVAGSGTLRSFNDGDLFSVIHALSDLWPECKLVKGRARHSESNGGVERLNQTVQRRMAAWMSTTGSRSWSVGCLLVQWVVNTSWHATIKTTPYELMFGQPPRCGISQLPFSENFISRLSTEQELMAALSSMHARNPAESADDDDESLAQSPSPRQHTQKAPPRGGPGGRNVCQ